MAGNRSRAVIAAEVEAVSGPVCQKPIADLRGVQSLPQAGELILDQRVHRVEDQCPHRWAPRLVPALGDAVGSRHPALRAGQALLLPRIASPPVAPELRTFS